MRDDTFTASLTIPSRAESVRLAAGFLVQTAKALGVPAAGENLFEVAVAEALNNAVKHGSPDPNDSVLCEIELDRGRLTIRVLARTPIPAAVVMPNLAQPLAEFSPDDWASIPESGYGLRLIATVFPQVRHVSRPDRHGIEMELSY